MRYILAKLLNLPWTIIGFLVAILSLPKSFSLNTKPLAIIIDVQSFWWYTWLPRHKGARGMALGNIVLLGPNGEKGDKEHELVHVEQFERMPFIFFFLNWFETMKHGPRYGKYENEAYVRANNIYKGETNG